MNDHLRTVARAHLRVGASLLVLLLLAACGSADGAGSGGGSAPDGATSAGPLDTVPLAAAPVGGRVTDAAGSPVAGALVEAVSLDSPARPVPERAVLTDGDGRYEWYGLADGRYRLEVTTGGRSGEAEATARSGSSVRLDLVVR